MGKKARQPKPSSDMRTIGREAADKTTGCALTVIGGLMVIGAITMLLYSATESDGNMMAVSGALWLIGLILAIRGYNRMQKAQHVSWTREAIERDRYTSAKEERCPRCRSWNSSEADYCSKCGLPLRLRCAACGQTSTVGSQFCSSCGRALDNT